MNDYIKQKKFREKNIIVTLLFLVVIALCTCGTYVFITRITEKQCIERMEEAVKIVADDVRSKLSRDSTILGAMAEIIAAEDHPDEEDLHILINRFTPLTIARKINLLLPGDRIISQSGTAIDVTGKLSFEKEAALGEHVSERMQSLTDDNRMVIRHFFPIEKNGKVIAVLYSTTILKELPDSLNIQNIYGGSAEIYLVDRKSGDMLMDTLHDELGNIWDFASYESVGTKTVPESHNEVMSGQSGYNVFRSEDTGAVSYCYYAPIDDADSVLGGGDVNHWSVLVEVPEKIVMRDLNKVRNVCYVVGLIETAAILIYFLWMIRNTTVTMEKAILEERLTKAENAERAKTRFLSNMSHDIRTPMNAIIGFTTLASAHTGDSEKVQDYLSKILSSSNHLLSLINEILDMSRIESGKVEIKETECSIPDIVKDIENIIVTQANAKNINFHTDISQVQDMDIYCDKLHLNQVLLNLLSNAVKFTPDGGSVSFTIKQKEKIAEGRAEYEIRVKDTGIGMSPEFLERVFEPFERESTSTVSGIQGTGLGMSIAKSIVDMMGGTIEAFSEQGKGTEYVLTLNFRLLPPGKKVVSAKKTEEKSSALPVAAEDIQGKRLLLVEDNELNREIATEILTAAGFLIETACDGTEAVDIMQKAKSGYFDLILMDVQMPIMNGYDAAKAIRAMEDPDIANIPIVAMTANAFEEDRELALKNGMNDHLAKPIDINKIFEVIGKCLKKES